MKEGTYGFKYICPGKKKPKPKQINQALRSKLSHFFSSKKKSQKGMMERNNKNRVNSKK